MLAKQGEFYVTEDHKGRLGSKSLNQLRQALRENEFTDVLYGFSVGAYLFHEAEPGTIVGPLRGPEGYLRGARQLADPRRAAPCRSRTRVSGS